MMTVLSKTGKIVSSRFKYTKNHNETKSILLGIKNIRDEQNVGKLKHLSLDDPQGEVGPFNHIFPELLDGTASYVESSSIPKIILRKGDDYLFFKKFGSLQ